MENFLEELYFNYGELMVDCPKEEQRIASRKGNLKKVLKKNQYRQVTRIMDDVYAISDETALKNFVCGVKFGVQLMTEIYRREDVK